jgi:CrcB protein
MTLPTDPAYLVGTGAAIGAVARYLVANLVVRWQGTGPFPTATLVVNVIGSFVLGLVVLGEAGEPVPLLIGTGVCGAFTTYSSFSVQTVRLWEDGKAGLAVVNAVGNFALSAAAVGLAWLLVG